MNNILVLDVTLRDGGCVNNFNFGQKYMNEILTSLECSGVEFIELGYIDGKSGSEQGRTQFINEKVIYKYFLKTKKKNCTYVAMMDYGKFDVDLLEDCNEHGVDGIRVAFHKKDWQKSVQICKKILAKGYQVFVQPMLTMRYSDNELLQLIDAVNSEIPNASGMYIVDSFGEMHSNDVIRKMHLIDNNLNPEMKIGFHSHNNLQLSYSNAMALLEYKTNREIMLDASVMGMGKGAGNLNTELLMEHLNVYCNKEYFVAPLLGLIDKVINVVHKELYWGYAVEYYLASINRCTPSYASHFYNKHRLPIEQVAELLASIPEEKKISFDKNFAETLYLEYNSRKTYDDTKVIEELKAQFQGKDVLLIAPGKSIEKNREKIKTKVKGNNLLSISLNNFAFNTDYVIITRAELLETAIDQGCSIIVPSNIITTDECVKVIDYKKWIIEGEKTYDSSGVISLQLISALKPNKVCLAGFDGFSVDINQNYFDKTLRRPVNEEQAEHRNKFYSELIQAIKNDIDIEFVTESKYQPYED